MHGSRLSQLSSIRTELVFVPGLFHLNLRKACFVTACLPLPLRGTGVNSLLIVCVVHRISQTCYALLSVRSFFAVLYNMMLLSPLKLFRQCWKQASLMVFSFLWSDKVFLKKPNQNQPNKKATQQTFCMLCITWRCWVLS